MADSSHTRPARAGRKLGLRVPEPELEKGESIRWEDRANLFRGRLWAVGGGLFLSNRRLIFVPNKIESKVFFGKTWSVDLADLDRAFVGGGMLKTVRVVGRDGVTSRFVIGGREKAAARIDAAIRTARPRAAGD
ncbi:MAG TPA: hypothetical protein VGC32_21430 [Solirubrobacterales bacterium]